MQIQAYLWKLSFMQICLSNANHLFYLKMLLFAGKYAEMKQRMGQKRKLKKKKN
jgi:hypothetical protein